MMLYVRNDSPNAFYSHLSTCLLLHGLLCVWEKGKRAEFQIFISLNNSNIGGNNFIFSKCRLCPYYVT